MNDLFSESELFEERAAIREFDGKQTREEAEKAAREEVEEHKRRCMVRQLLKWKAVGESDKAQKWISKQKEPAKWKEVCNEQWQLGNRGEFNDWRAK